MDQTLKIVSWNIHGFDSHKSDADLKVYLCTFDVIILSETWTKLDSDVSDFLPDYTTFCVHGKRRSKRGRQPGGIAVFVKNSISKLIKCIKKTDLGLFLLLDKGNSSLTCDIIIACVYIPCDGSTFSTDRIETNGIYELEQSIAEIVTEHSDCNIILCGDLNSRTGVCDDFIIEDDISYIHDSDWYTEDNFNIKRKSRDKDGRLNTFGYSLLEFVTFGIHIVNVVVQWMIPMGNLHSAHQTVQVVWIMWLHPPNYSRLLPCLKLMITTHRITFRCAVIFSIVYLSNKACTRPLNSIPGIAGHPRGKTSFASCYWTMMAPPCLAGSVTS